jgi:hypothetical protein
MMEAVLGLPAQQLERFVLPAQVLRYQDPLRSYCHLSWPALADDARPLLR